MGHYHRDLVLWAEFHSDDTDTEYGFVGYRLDREHQRDEDYRHDQKIFHSKLQPKFWNAKTSGVDLADYFRPRPHKIISICAEEF